jgi:hypothetical protein
VVRVVGSAVARVVGRAVGTHPWRRRRRPPAARTPRPPPPPRSEWETGPGCSIQPPVLHKSGSQAGSHSRSMHAWACPAHVTAVLLSICIQHRLLPAAARTAAASETAPRAPRRLGPAPGPTERRVKGMPGCGCAGHATEQGVGAGSSARSRAKTRSDPALCRCTTHFTQGVAIKLGMRAAGRGERAPQHT